MKLSVPVKSSMLWPGPLLGDHLFMFFSRPEVLGKQAMEYNQEAYS